MPLVTVNVTRMEGPLVPSSLGPAAYRVYVKPVGEGDPATVNVSVPNGDPITLDCVCEDLVAHNYTMTECP